MLEELQSVQMIAGLLDLTPRRVQQLARAGVLPKPEHGRYDLIGCVRGYVGYLQARGARTGRPCRRVAAGAVADS